MTNQKEKENQPKNKQNGGRLDCGLTENAPSILLLGHSCEYMGRTLPVPPNWVYVTSGVCGLLTRLGSILLFINDFFENKPFFKMPCNQYELSKQYSNGEEILNFHYKNAPHISNQTYQDINFSPLLTSYRDSNKRHLNTLSNRIVYWECFKSGIYTNNTSSSYDLLSQIVTIVINSDKKIIINESQIRSIYEGAIYPNVEVIINKTNRIKLLRGSTEPEGQYDIYHFEEAVESFKITLSQIIKLLEGVDIKEGVVFNPLCRKPCGDGLTSYPIANFRRTLSKQALLANDEYHAENPDVPLKQAEFVPEDYLGGKRRKKNNKSKKSRKDKKRKIQKKKKNNTRRAKTQKKSN